MLFRSEEEEALRTGLSLGMTLIDTSGDYGEGRSEELIKRVIAGQRDRAFVVSGTTAASRNLTVCAVPFKATAVAAWRANAPDDATNEHSAPQSPLNSRRFRALFTTLSFPLLTMLGLRIVLPNRFHR